MGTIRPALGIGTAVEEDAEEEEEQEEEDGGGDDESCCIATCLSQHTSWYLRLGTNAHAAYRPARARMRADGTATRATTCRLARFNLGTAPVTRCWPPNTHTDPRRDARARRRMYGAREYPSCACTDAHSKQVSQGR